MIGFNTIPKVAVIRILVIWFGVGTVPAVITAFLLSFFPILVNVATGIATAEPELQDVLRALDASRWQVIQKVGLPRSMPYFFASLKVAITVAFVGPIVAETVAANKGIGHLMLVASSRFEVPHCLCWPVGDERDGNRHVFGRRGGRTADDRMGHARRRQRDDGGSRTMRRGRYGSEGGRQAGFVPV